MQTPASKHSIRSAMNEPARFLRICNLSLAHYVWQGKHLLVVCCLACTCLARQPFRIAIRLSRAWDTHMSRLCTL